MQFTHARDAGLAALLVRVDAEGGVFLGQSLQRDAEFVLVGLRLGLNSHFDDRLGEHDRLEHDRVIRIAQGVAGEGFLQAHSRGDVAGIYDIHFFAVIGMHLKDAADPLLLALGPVQNVRACLQVARIDPEVGELSNVRICGDLEGQGAERRAVVNYLENLGMGNRLNADDRGHIERRREEVHDAVQNGLNALVLQGGACQHGYEAVVEGPDPEAAFDVRGAEVVAFEILVSKLVVHLGHGLDHLLALRLGRFEKVGRDVYGLFFGSKILGLVDDRLHRDQINNALELLLHADRQLDDHRPRPESLADHVHAAPEVGSGPVQLVDKADTRDRVAIRLSPDRLRLGLDARNAIEDDDRTVQDAQAALDLNSEVHVPGRIDDVDSVIVPEARCSCGSNRNAALLLLGHPVHGGRALMDLTDLVDLLRIEKDPLGDRGLPSVDMGNDSNVPRLRERN